MAPASSELDLSLRVVMESDQACVAPIFVETIIGAANDKNIILQAIEGADVLTFEHEHVSGEMLRELIAAGHSVQPGPDALIHAQNKIVMRQKLTELGLPNPDWVALPQDETQAHQILSDFIARHDGSAVVKTAWGGYDGKGVKVVSDASEASEWIANSLSGGPQLLVEEKVPYTRELAALVARRPSGEIKTWQIVESIQTNGVCDQVISPAPNLSVEWAQEIQDLAAQIAAQIGVTGVLAVELFEVQTASGSRIVVNELAMRPHNSGHWTITGSVTSQFEQHLRAVLDLPLGDTSAVAPWTVMANILGANRNDLSEGLAPAQSAYPQAKINLYGKEVRPGRKLGHVNVSGSDLQSTLEAAIGAVKIIQGQGA